MRLKETYVQKLANNIEKKLKMSSNEISKLTREEFKQLLKDGYFAQKQYVKERHRQEPTQKQLDVLGLHYGIPTNIKVDGTIGADNKFFYTTFDDKRVYIDRVKAIYDRNGRKRYKDGKTGKFVSTKAKIKNK